VDQGVGGITPEIARFIDTAEVPVKKPKPVTTTCTTFGQLPEHFKEAVYEATSHFLQAVPDDWLVRVERYRTSDIQRVIEKAWHWQCHIDAIAGDDRVRVQNIIDQIQDGDPVWPYVSYWAADMDELMRTEGEDDEFIVPNHGDGWHRIIANVELQFPHIDVLFIERQTDTTEAERHTNDPRPHPRHDRCHQSKNQC